MALDLARYVAARRRPTASCASIPSITAELREWPCADIGGLRRAGHWSDYAIGVAQELVAPAIAIEP